MNVRILTLFDDEPIAPQPRASNRRRAIKMEQAATTASIEEEKAITPTPQKQKTQRATKSKEKTFTASSEKSYYTIGETAEIFGVRTSHIRFWTTEFGIKVRTTRKGDRLYTPENIKLLQSINTLVKIQGYTIAGAKQKLKELKNTIVAEPQAVTVKDALLILKENLISLLNQL